MTREEEIKNMLIPILSSMRAHGSTEAEIIAYRNGFTTGAMWRQTHPHWISVEDELPEREGDYSDFSIRVLATDGKDVHKAMLLNDGTWFTHDLWVLENVTHWMPLPSIEPLKKGDKK